jgi:hypothetical protein
LVFPVEAEKFGETKAEKAANGMRLKTTGTQDDGKKRGTGGGL